MNLKQSTAYNLPILMVDSTDHITGKTGLTLTITASKNGAAFGSITPTVTELATGWYNLALTTAHTDTLGLLALHITATGADPMDTAVQIFATTTDDLVRATTPANTLDVSATGEAGLDFANIKAATGSTTLTNIIVPTVTDVTNNQSKYMHGSVWIDTLNGAAGSASYTNGIMTNPSNSIANAKAIADNLKLKRFWVQAGSALTMAAGMAGYYFDGRGWALTNASSRDISGTTIIGCENLTGVWTSPSAECYVYWSQVGTSTWGEVDFHDCHIVGTITLNAAVPYLFDNCIGITPNSPIIDFNSTSDVRAAILKDFGGSVTVKNMKAGNVLVVNGSCDLVIDDTNTAGTVYITGNVRLTNNGSGQTVYDTARWDEGQNITNVTGTLDTVTNLTNLPAVTTDWLTAAGVKADAVTKIQNGLALEATLTAIKGAGWSTETLAAIDVLIDAIKAKTDNLPASPAATGDTMALSAAYDAAKTAAQAGDAMTLTAAYDKAKDDVLTPLAVVDGIVDAIKAKTDNLPASPAAVGSAMTLTAAYDDAKTAAQAGDAMTLTAAYDPAKTAAQAGDAMTLTSAYDKAKDDVLTPLATVDTVVDAIKAKTDNLPASPAAVGSAMTLTAAYDKAKDDVLTPLAVVDGVVDAIKLTVDTNLDSKISAINTKVALSRTEAVSVASGRLELTPYYSFSQAITSTLTVDLSAPTKLWFAIKESDVADANGLVLIEKTAGLTIVNRNSYATIAHGSLAVSGSAGDWTVTISMDEIATALLESYDGKEYDASLKVLVGNNAIAVWDGKCRIKRGLVRTYA